jgi:SWIM zinc finger
MVWFEDADLRRLAGGASYRRGLGYVQAISELDELPGAVLATVHGSGAYEVRLSDRDGVLAGACTCPVGQDGAFCKHCVAVGLALLADPAAADRDGPRRKRTASVRSKPDLRSYLGAVDPAELVELLLELAAEDPALQRRLSLRAAVTGEPDVAELRRLVDGLRARGFLEYAASYSYARKATDVLAALETVAAAHPRIAGPLCRRALAHITKASEQADDSSGLIGDAAADAVAAYAAACRAAPPDQAELARWLIDFQLDGPGWPDIDITEFADALGPDGLAAYRAYLGELAAGSSGGGDRYDHRRFTIRHLREGYLKSIEGDVDALVALYADDLPEPYQYPLIAETLIGADRAGEAVTWLERGLREADRPDRRLDDRLAELYTAAGATPRRSSCVGAASPPARTLRPTARCWTPPSWLAFRPRPVSVRCCTSPDWPPAAATTPTPW